jgi:hypothetical protein
MLSVSDVPRMVADLIGLTPNATFEHIKTSNVISEGVSRKTTRKIPDRRRKQKDEG